jgi:hypothetical protein
MRVGKGRKAGRRNFKTFSFFKNCMHTSLNMKKIKRLENSW